LGGRAGFTLVVSSSQPAKHHQKRSSTIVSTFFRCVLHGFELRKATASIPTAYPQQTLEPIFYTFFSRFRIVVLYLNIGHTRQKFILFNLRSACRAKKNKSINNKPAFQLPPSYRASYRSSLGDFFCISDRRAFKNPDGLKI